MSSLCFNDDDDVQTIAVTHVEPKPKVQATLPSVKKKTKDHSEPAYGVTYEFNHAVNLDKVLEQELKGLDIGLVLQQHVAPLETQVEALENQRTEIDRILTAAFDDLQVITSQYTDENNQIVKEIQDETAKQDVIVIEEEEPEIQQEGEAAQKLDEEPLVTASSDAKKLTNNEELVIDDDEDVQIVDTTYEEPKRKSLPPPPTTPTKKSVTSKTSNIIKVNGPLDSTQLAKLADGQLIQMVNDDGKKIKTYRVRKVPFYQTQRRAALSVPVTGQTVYGMKRHEVWYKGVLQETLVDESGVTRYKVRFDGKGMRAVTGKELAWYNDKERLPLGTRIIAPYREVNKVSYYAGITAEPPSTRNNYRYLVFFDDGYAQYSKVDDVMQVYSQNMNVWCDVSTSSRDFIKQYLEQYPERPMVRLSRNQVVKTEWNGQWWTARVLEVDASLVKMFFDSDKRTEWIYRGSTRLAPLYTELANAEANRVRGRQRRYMSQASSRRPYVEYTRNHGDDNDVIVCDEPNKSPGASYSNQSETPTQTFRHEERRAVAKKSTGNINRNKDYAIPSRTVPRIPHSLDALPRRETEDPEEESLGSRVELSAATLRMYERQRSGYIQHRCSPHCSAGIKGVPADYKGRNPLTIPMYFGWERQIAKLRISTGKHHVFYRSPCGRRLRSMEEVDRYLFRTDSLLTIDLFCFDPFIHPFMEFNPVKTYCDIKDLSYGRENVPISCVNNCDRKYPDYVEYSNQRLPAKGVTLNLDPEFLCGCDCEDDCRDRSKCACRQLTVEMTGATRDAIIDPDAGYDLRRLDVPILTGIYECNAQCKCSDRCHNRVVQNGLSLRLQVFKTEKRGWGLRCLDDIPCGGFVCIYAGQLLTDAAANEDGNQYGDEYLAELDHIETIAGLKEGYEDDVIPVSEEESEESDVIYSGESDGDSDRQGNSSRQGRRSGKKSGSANLGNDDDDYLPDPRRLKEQGSKPSTRREPNESDDSDDNNTATSAHGGEFSRLSKMPDPKSLARQPKSDSKHCGFINPRKYFGEDQCYIMDAKSIGNIGRYLNHSCEPNIFVQNVFVDTHDLRFPWVSFFASENIRAGTELTWDYNYNVDSVEGKVLYCYCGSKKCRGRLL